uniref:Uncharacterized protein n=1 Tax=Acrobeloides nanus TaxID=290746 RepID=A0A914DI65_9BILA
MLRRQIFLDQTTYIYGKEVEINNNEETTCPNKNGLHKEHQSIWEVLDYENLPEWLRDNEYLKSNHRPIVQNYAACFRSIFKLHSETGNIWTHLIGCLIFVAIAAYFWVNTEGHVSLHDKLVFLAFFASAILCLGLSTLFHTVCCHSAEVFVLFRKLDYLGIAVMIIGSMIPMVYYWFYCETIPKLVYISMIVVLGSVVIYVTLSPIFGQNNYRHLRAIVFASMSFTILIPATHYALTHGIYRLHLDRFDLFLLMGFLYIFGAVVYTTRIPERFFPGKCDIWLHSHQLFHLLVVLGAITHYIQAYEMATHRLNGHMKCSN